MQLPEESYLLRIFIGESDRHDGKPLYEWIVVQARARELAGATVLRGLMGYGANTREIQTFKIERLSTDLPLIIEIVDEKEKLENFLASIESTIKDGLVTMEKVQIRLYRSHAK
jgi:PII-like signaling protein